MSILHENRLPLIALAQRENIHICTAHRWRLKGVRGVKLDTLTIGGRVYTSNEAFARFVAAINGEAAPTATPSRTNRARDAAIAQAERELAADGI